MSGISKTIERVKNLYWRYQQQEIEKNWNNFQGIAAKSIMPIITAYEESQKELETTNDCLDTIGETHSGLLELYHKTNDELSKANKRIAAFLIIELAMLDIVLITTDENKTESEILNEVKVKVADCLEKAVKEQTDERR